MGDLHHPPLFASQPAAGLHLRLTLPLETRGVLLFQLMSHMWWAGLDSNQRIPKEIDLQSTPFNHLGTDPYWCTFRDLNPGPPD